MSGGTSPVLGGGGVAGKREETAWAFVSGPDELWRLIASAAGPQDAQKREFMIKVNWYSPHPANYTGPAALDMLLRALPGRATVVEGHSSGRTDGSRYIEAGQAVGEAREWLRAQERDFLRQTGIQEVLDRHRVAYLNVTEEAWAGRTVAPAVVRQALAGTPGGAAVNYEELLAFVPAALYERRHDALLIDFARLKLTVAEGQGFSLGLKNMFGLIPEPDRSPYHDHLPAAILDVNRIYHALFDVVTLCEALESVIVYRPEGKYPTPWGSFDIDARHPGLVIGGRNPLAVDLVAGSLFGLDFAERDVVTEARKFFAMPEGGLLARARDFGRDNGLAPS